jgi:hypothetical protein
MFILGLELDPELDPVPGQHSSENLDPDPHIMYADPKHWEIGSAGDRDLKLCAVQDPRTILQEHQAHNKIGTGKLPWIELKSVLRSRSRIFWSEPGP